VPSQDEQNDVVIGLNCNSNDNGVCESSGYGGGSSSNNDEKRKKKKPDNLSSRYHVEYSEN